MRVFPWLLALALAIECLAGSLLARYVMRSLADEQRAPPMFTSWFFDHPTWWLLVPVPWVICALILSRRPEAAVGSVLVFAGIVAVVAAFLLGVMLIAAILPTLRFKG